MLTNYQQEPLRPTSAEAESKYKNCNVFKSVYKYMATTDEINHESHLISIKEWNQSIPDNIIPDSDMIFIDNMATLLTT